MKKNEKRKLEKSKKIINEEKGITLVSLVITIIIIIILATVAISFAFGNNGLINRAQDASGMYANDTAYTEGSITNVESYINDVLIGETDDSTDEPVEPPFTPTPVEEILEEGDYVYYEDGTGVTRECVVLYGPENANYSSYGIQIITMETVEDVTLGYNDTTVTGSDNFTKSMNSYNNAISTLNNATSKYLNITYAESVRCVGSVPDNPSYDGAGMFTSSYSYMSSYNGLFKDTDENYLTDWNQMNALNIYNLGENYWLTSRYVDSSSGSSIFNVRYVPFYGLLFYNQLCFVNSYR